MQIPLSLQGQILLQDVTQNGTWDGVQTRTIVFAMLQFGVSFPKFGSDKE